MKILQYKQKKIVQLNYGNSHKVEYYADIENDVAEYLITWKIFMVLLKEKTHWKNSKNEVNCQKTVWMNCQYWQLFYLNKSLAIDWLTHSLFTSSSLQHPLKVRGGSIKWDIGISLMVFLMEDFSLPIHGRKLQSLVRGAKIPCTLSPKNQNIKQKQYCNKFKKDF